MFLFLLSFFFFVLSVSSTGVRVRCEGADPLCAFTVDAPAGSHSRALVDELAAMHNDPLLSGPGRQNKRRTRRRRRR